MSGFVRRDVLRGLVAACVVRARARQQDEAVFTANVKVVNVFATVRQKNGALVADLGKDDFTLAEDELPPEHYGEDALWMAIETEIGLGLRAVLQPGLADLYYRRARPHILASAVLAGSAAALPNPAVSLPLIAAIDATA